MPDSSSPTRRQSTPPVSGSPSGVTHAAQSTVAALLSAAYRSWYVVVTATIVAAAVGWAYASSKPASYESTASILFRNVTVGGLAQGNSGFGSNDPDRQAQTRVDQIELPSVATRAATTLGPGWTTDAVQGAYRVEAGGQSDIVKVIATGAKPSDASRVANAVVTAAVEFRAENARRDSIDALKAINAQIASLSASQRVASTGQVLLQRQSDLRLAVASPGGDAEVAQRARIPTASVTTAPIRLAVLAGIAGLLIGLALALLRARVDPKVTTESQLQSIWSVPVLATLAKDKHLSKGTYANASSASLAPLTIARTSLRYLSTDRPADIVGVASAVSGEGKTTVSWGMAAAAAAEGARVLLIEADLREPSLRRVRNVPESPGVTAFLAGHGGFTDIVRTVGAGTDLQFDVIPAGETSGTPLPLLRGPQTAELFAVARAQYDFVVVDLPPVTLVPDTMTLAPHLDGIVSVVRMRWVSPGTLARERDLLEEIDTPIYGVILNRSLQRAPVSYGGTVNRPAMR